MERERLGNGRYRVFLSDEELQDWGLTFERLDRRSPCTRALLFSVFTAVSEGDALCADGVTVEVFPVEGGCFLLLSGENTAEETSGKTPVCAGFDSVDALWAFCKAAQPHLFGESSLYRLENRLWLVLTPTGETAHLGVLLSEFMCECCVGTGFAAFLKEHGTAVYIGDALQRLYEAG